MQHRKSRSKDYDAYTDDDICNQEPEDNFAKELQQYIQAKEMASVTQSLPCPEESVKKETAKGGRKGRERSSMERGRQRIAQFYLSICGTGKMVLSQV